MDTEKTPWEAAWERFEQGYAAGPPDLNDPGDQVAFAAIFEAEVRRRARTEQEMEAAEITEQVEARARSELRRLSHD